MSMTMIELLSDYIVIIPQLQRDYAQGRIKHIELRNSFVYALKKALQDNEHPLNLDFVYGYTSLSKLYQPLKEFYPLDGQQRLTTLWLLFWLLAPKENGFITQENRQLLKNFSYETRLSSKRFCTCLVMQTLILLPGRTIENSITQSPWFMESWKKDPTIVSMLTMLNTLDVAFDHKEAAWIQFSQNKKITFDFIDIKSEEFKLSDELYIKMNSRGIGLTKFESFKAQFISALSDKTTEYFSDTLNYRIIDDENIIEKKLPYQDYFSFKIDSVWMDMFWNYRQKLDINTDVAIHNLMSYFAEFFYYKKEADREAPKESIMHIFLHEGYTKKKEIISFIFKSLDWLSIVNNHDEFFTSLFSNISLFDMGTKNYFKRAITENDFDVKDKLLFYTILRYYTSAGITEVNEDAKTLLRIVRNLLVSTRQINQSRKIALASELRLSRINNYCQFIDSIIHKKIIDSTRSFYDILLDEDLEGFGLIPLKVERQKAIIILKNPSLKNFIHGLEDHNQIRGMTINFKLNSENITEKINSFHKIWSNDTQNHLICRALLTIEDYSIQTHYSSLGEIYHFGSKGDWHRILTSHEDSRDFFSDVLDSFLTIYSEEKGNSPNEKLNAIISQYIVTPRELFDWRYYFIAYETFLNIPDLTFLDIPTFEYNLFSWGDKDGFAINALGNPGPRPLNSYHFNPYLLALFENSGEMKKNFKKHSGRFAEPSFMIYKKLFSILVHNNGWFIQEIEPFRLPENIIKETGLAKVTDGYLLKFFPELDCIEQGLAFISLF